MYTLCETKFKNLPHRLFAWGWVRNWAAMGRIHWLPVFPVHYSDPIGCGAAFSRCVPRKFLCNEERELIRLAELWKRIDEIRVGCVPFSSERQICKRRMSDRAPGPRYCWHCRVSMGRVVLRASDLSLWNLNYCGFILIFTVILVEGLNCKLKILFHF